MRNSDPRRPQLLHTRMFEHPHCGHGRRIHMGVWCSLSEKSYSEIAEHWEDPSRESLGPYFGWLCAQIPGYPDTAFLKTMVHQQPVGIKPLIELEPTNHPLAIDQREGIQVNRIQSIVM